MSRSATATLGKSILAARLEPEPHARAQELVSLLNPMDARDGWTINNGAEFPGATGTLTVDADAKREGRDSLKLVGDSNDGKWRGPLTQLAISITDKSDAKTKQSPHQLQRRRWRLATALRRRSRTVSRRVTIRLSSCIPCLTRASLATLLPLPRIGGEGTRLEYGTLKTCLMNQTGDLTHACHSHPQHRPARRA